MHYIRRHKQRSESNNAFEIDFNIRCLRANIDDMYVVNSTAAMYLRPAMKQVGSRLNVLTNALVTRVTFNKQQATGIEYRYDGQTKHALATREVHLLTLCSTAFYIGLYVRNIES